MNVDIAQKLVTPATQPAVSSPETTGESTGAKGPSFQDRLQNSPDANALDPASSTQRVNGANVPQQEDLFGHFEKVHKEFDNFLQRTSEIDKLVAEGKLKPTDPKVVQHNREEMRMLLHFQSEMQSAGVKVEIASKVVEHATSGVKTVLSTQA